jgi:hypothetical protein
MTSGLISKIPTAMTAVLICFAIGCTSTSTSNTARTAKEQLLLSNAVDQSLDKVDFSPLHQQRVFIDDKFLECVDKGYVLGSIRHRIMRTGGIVTATADDADVVMELRSGGVGTDTTDAFMGIPEITLPGMLTLPEIRFAERKTQNGYAKLGMVLYDAKSKNVLGDGGLAMAESADNNWSVMGIGPYQSGTLKTEVARARMIPPGTNRRQLPSQVAFRSRDNGEDPQATTRFASESKTQP